MYQDEEGNLYIPAPEEWPDLMWSITDVNVDENGDLSYKLLGSDDRVNEEDFKKYAEATIIATIKKENSKAFAEELGL